MSRTARRWSGGLFVALTAGAWLAGTDLAVAQVRVPPDRPATGSGQGLRQPPAKGTKDKGKKDKGKADKGPKGGRLETPRISPPRFNPPPFNPPPNGTFIPPSGGYTPPAYTPPSTRVTAVSGTPFPYLSGQGPVLNNNPFLNPNNVGPFTNPLSNPYSNPFQNPYANPYSNPFQNPYSFPQTQPYPLQPFNRWQYPNYPLQNVYPQQGYPNPWAMTPYAQPFNTFPNNPGFLPGPGPFFPQQGPFFPGGGFGGGTFGGGVTGYDVFGGWTRPVGFAPGSLGGY